MCINKARRKILYRYIILFSSQLSSLKTIEFVNKTHNLTFR